MKTLMGRLNKDMLLVHVGIYMTLYKALKEEDMDNIVIISALRGEFGRDEGFHKPLVR
jgi:hypothetical protein